MNSLKTRNAILALIALAALSCYILACTAFSPDDSKILYPAFDAESGSVGMAVYDRVTQKSQMMFVPAACDLGESNAVAEPLLMRGEWLPDGRSVLIGFSGGKDNDTLNLALMPFGSTASVRLLQLADVKEEGLLLPLCVNGGKIFLKAGDKAVARIDLKSLAVARHEFSDIQKEIVLYSAPNADGPFYVEPLDGDKGEVFGRLNPESFSRTPLMTITNELHGESAFAYDNEGKTIAFLQPGDTNRLLVLRQGKPAWIRTIDAKGAKWAFGNAGLSPKGDMLWATYMKQVGTETVSYGLLEVPFSEEPVRETTLLTLPQPVESDKVFYFQGSVSHDGKIAAIASTYLACTAKEFKPDDCALFLVDLSSPDRKVTKVPIPLPANRPGAPGK
jgi:hypothetical protein